MWLVALDEGRNVISTFDIEDDSSTIFQYLLAKYAKQLLNSIATK